jgi:hypothetical protein
VTPLGEPEAPPLRPWAGTAMPALESEGSPLSLFEFWPPALFYAPVVLCWAWLSLRHRSVTLPTLANPGLEAGGLCGESKGESLALLGPEGRRRLAPFVTLRTGSAVADVDRDLAAALAAMADAGLRFPLVAKPDIGCRGTAVRIIATPEELRAYFRAFPRDACVMLQHLVPDEGEAGVFYVRRPGEAEGRIVSLTLKYFPRVVGNGRSTLEELIRADPRAGHVAALYLARHAGQRHRVLAPGEAFKLTWLGNHCRGAVFRDGARFVTPAMAQGFDRIAREIPGFFMGRFDVRFRSLSDLMQGGGFSIIEFNGVGSEATHIWDREATLRTAYGSWFSQLALSFEIGAMNRARGLSPMSTLALLRLWLGQRGLMKRYPAGS